VDPAAVVTLVGNKLDLVEERAITSAHAEAFDKLHQLAYLETCAVGGDNIEETFHRTATAVIRKEDSPLAPPDRTAMAAHRRCAC
jgi:hypothetical protein